MNIIIIAIIIIIIIFRFFFLCFLFLWKLKLKGKLWIPLVLEILSDDAMRGVLNCVVQKVLMRTEAGRNLFCLFPFGLFFLFFGR